MHPAIARGLLCSCQPGWLVFLGATYSPYAAMLHNGSLGQRGVRWCVGGSRQ